MAVAKRTLGVEELERQTAVELPDRDMMALLTIVVAGNNIDIIDDVTVTVQNVDIAAQVCGVLNTGAVTCDVNQ